MSQTERAYSLSLRFAKQKRWERWRAKRKLVSGSKHLGRFWDAWVFSRKKKFEILYAKSCNLVHFGRKMFRNAVMPQCAHKHFNNGYGVPTRSALSVTSTAPLQLRHAACGAILVLYTPLPLVLVEFLVPPLTAAGVGVPA